MEKVDNGSFRCSPGEQVTVICRVSDPAVRVAGSWRGSASNFENDSAETDGTRTFTFIVRENGALVLVPSFAASSAADATMRVFAQGADNVEHSAGGIARMSGVEEKMIAFEPVS